MTGRLKGGYTGIKGCVYEYLSRNILYFSVEGKRHDARMLAQSNLLQQLDNYAFSPTGEMLCIYGDPAYPLRLRLQAPFREVNLTPAMIAYNESMSKVRESVEWLFKDIINYFKFMDFKKNLKIGLSQVVTRHHSILT